MFELEAQGFSLAHLGSRQAMPILIHEFRVLGLVEESIVFFLGVGFGEKCRSKGKNLVAERNLIRDLGLLGT